MPVQRLEGGNPTTELPFGILVTHPRELNVTLIVNTKTTGWKTWQWTMARKWFSEDGKCNSNKMTKVMPNYGPIGQIQLGSPLKRVFSAETGLLWPNSWQMMMLTASGYSIFIYCGTGTYTGCWQIRSSMELNVTWSVGRLNIMTAKFKRQPLFIPGCGVWVSLNSAAACMFSSWLKYFSACLHYSTICKHITILLLYKMFCRLVSLLKFFYYCVQIPDIFGLWFLSFGAM